MYIDSIFIKNFKNVNFDNKIKLGDYGTFIIRGANGSGKTNFLNAISFVFGLEWSYNYKKLIKNGENNAFVNIDLKNSDNSSITKHITYSKNGNLISFIRPKNTDISHMFKSTDFCVILDAHEKSKEEVLQDLSKNYKVYLLDNISILFNKKESETLLYPKLQEMKNQKKTVFLTSTQKIDGFKNIEVGKND